MYYIVTQTEREPEKVPQAELSLQVADYGADEGDASEGIRLTNDGNASEKSDSGFNQRL